MNLNTHTIKRILPIALLILILGQTLIFAIKDKMHERIPECLDHYAEAISIVISQVTFNLQGYMGDRNIYDTLIANGFDWDHHEDPVVLNQAIQKARIVAVNGEHMLFSVGDMGLIDYTRLAFTLFGYKIESLLFLYFFVLFLQVGVFFIQFRKNDLVVAGLILFLLAHYIILNGLYTAGYNLWTVHNNRFLSVLNILPLAHIVLLALFQRPLRLNVFMGALVQILIFILVLRSRSSAFWMLVPLLFIGGIVALGWLTKWKNLSAFRRVKLWPVFMVLGAVFLSIWVKPYVLNSEYYGEKHIANHPFWYPIYVGLAIDPDMRKIYGPRPRKEEFNADEYFRSVCHESHSEDSRPQAQVRELACRYPGVVKPVLVILRGISPWVLNYTHNDLDGQRAAVKWLNDNGKTEKHLCTFGPDEKVDYLWWFGTPSETLDENLRKLDPKKDFKWREMDRILGLVVKDAFINHSLLVLKVIFITKPFFFLLYCLKFFFKLKSLWVVLLTVITCGYLLFHVKQLPAEGMRKLLAFVGALFAFSMIVPLTAYPAPHTISDQIVLLTCCILALILYVLHKKWTLRRS